MNSKIPGLHHVTAIASDPQRNLDFYVGVLGLRFVKRTVNFDDPGTYHFYFGDRRGTPGTILTFFPWPGVRRGIRGTGQIEATAFSISPNSVDYWLERLKQQHVGAERIPSRFGDEVIRFVDPDGLLLELIASNSLASIEPWPDSTVPPEHALRGFHSVFRFASHDDTALSRIVDLLCLPDSALGVSPRGPCITSRSAHATNKTNFSGANSSWIFVTMLLRSSIAFIFIQSIFANRAGCCSRSPPSLLVLPSTKQSKNLGPTCASRHGWNLRARRSRRFFHRSTCHTNNEAAAGFPS